MAGRSAIACCTAVIAMTLSACAGHGPLPPAGRLDGQHHFGFNDDPDPATFAAQARIGMDVRRLVVPWGTVEPVRGTWDWEPYDSLYRQMRDAGLVPLVVAVGSPCWARPDTVCSDVQPPNAPAFDADWANYTRQLALRYPDALGIEIWNEPNATAMWPPRPDPVRYTALLERAYRAVKSGVPRMPVVSGGLQPSVQDNAVALADGPFLASMYRAGARRAMDAIGAHPYPTTSTPPSLWQPAQMEAGLDRLRTVRDAAGDRRRPLWITETGVSTSTGPGFPPAVDEATQAQELLALVDDVRHDPDVPVMLVHRLVDGTPGTVEAGFGVLRADQTPKPAACALSAAFAGTLPCGPTGAAAR